MAMTREQERAIALARVRRQRQQKEEGGLSPVQGAGDAAALGAIRGATFGFLDEAASGIDYLLDKLPTRQGRSYEEILRQNRNEQTAADERFPVASTLGQVAGSLAVPLGATSQGLNIAGRGTGLLTKGLGYAGEGAAYGALAGAGNADGEGVASGTLNGAGMGAALGLAAPIAVAGVSRAVQPVVDSVRNSFGPASSQAAQRIGSQLRATNLADADVTQRLGELGPEGILADVMGARGQALARSASNVSPEARQTIEGFTGPRNATRNERVVGAIEDAAGLPAGSRQTVDDLKAAAYSQQEPAINAAYRVARALGYDLPLESFQEIIGSPLGSRTFREASKAVQNRMAAGDEGAASNLGLLDAMKRRLDAVGRVAGRAGDNDAASQATMLSNALRRQMDELLDAPQYAQARSMREAAYRTDDAFDQGAALAARRVPFDAASGARGGGQGPVRPEVAQGYAATIAQDLLNQPGGIDRLSAPLQREAMETALQGGSKRVQDQLARERVFQDTHRSVVGNSTTARQLKEMGVIAGAGTGLGVLGGLDIQQAGMAGIAAALLKRGGGAAVSKLRSGNEEKVAQEIANMLIGRGVPTTPQGVSVALRNPERARTIARILAGTGGAIGGS